MPFVPGCPCRILKGHFEDPHRPMHRALAKWRVLDNRLLPFVTKYAPLTE